MSSVYFPPAPSYSACSNWLPPSSKSAQPLPPKKAPHIWGSHADGSYVIAYSPAQPAIEIPKVVIYLHGFALADPWFYRNHLYHLVNEGCYVIFVDYQVSPYGNDDGSQYGKKLEESDLKELKSCAGDLLDTALDSFSNQPIQMIETSINNAYYALQQMGLATHSPEVYVFGHSVGGFLALSWIYGLQQLAQDAPVDINGSDDPPLNLANLELPYTRPTLTQAQLKGLMPKVIVAASPMDSTPGLNSALYAAFAKVFNTVGPLIDFHKQLPTSSPYLSHPLNISETGKALGDSGPHLGNTCTPTVMLLGNDDNLAPTASWEGSTWDDILASDKSQYISQAYQAKGGYQPEKTIASNWLESCHNQSVTNQIINLSFLGDTLAEETSNLIGGPGQLNAMRFNYIWSALDQVIKGADIKQLTFKMGNWSCADGADNTVAVAPIMQSSNLIISSPQNGEKIDEQITVTGKCSEQTNDDNENVYVAIWVDEATIPDMPGAYYYQGSWIVDPDHHFSAPIKIGNRLEELDTFNIAVGIYISKSPNSQYQVDHKVSHLPDLRICKLIKVRRHL